MTYREKAIERLISIGISGYNAKGIVNCYIAEEFATNVFDGFAQDNEDNWDNEFKIDGEWIEEETPLIKMAQEIVNLRGLDLIDDNIRLIVEEFS